MTGQPSSKVGPAGKWSRGQRMECSRPTRRRDNRSHHRASLCVTREARGSKTALPLPHPSVSRRQLAKLSNRDLRATVTSARGGHGTDIEKGARRQLTQFGPRVTPGPVTRMTGVRLGISALYWSADQYVYPGENFPRFGGKFPSREPVKQANPRGYLP